MTPLDILLFATGLIVLTLSLAAGYIVNRAWLSEVVLCLAAGAVLNVVLSYFMKARLLGEDRFSTLEGVTWVTLGIAVMGVALRLPSDALRENRRAIAIVLLVGMPLMWLTSAAMAWLFLGVGLVPALLIGSLVAPTDPVVSQSIISGRVAEEKVPARTRHLLLAESGANDGLGIAFVMLPIFLLKHSTGEAFGKWALETLLWEVLGAVVLGSLFGWLAARFFVWAKRQDYTENQPLLAIALALSLTVLAGTKFVGADGILAVFVSGLAFNYGIRDIESRQSEFHNALTRFFELPAFVLIGVLLPWQDWWRMGWPLVGLAIAILLLRRLPWWLVLARFIRPLRSRPEILFAGWFGPIGAAAAYYAMLANRESDVPDLWPIVSLTIVVSVVAHGITATPLANRLSSRLERLQD